MFTTIIGRGHSGTRAISHTLYASGVDMGTALNPSGDLVPAEDFYQACRIMGQHVKYLGGLRWDFSALHGMAINAEFKRLVESYLTSVLQSKAAHKGWKLPETVLVYPWIVRMFPELHYIYWVRDPRDCILGQHLTDDLSDFGIPCDRIDDVRQRRAASWKYQAQIYQATPRPKKLLEVRFEDFVLKQQATLRRLGGFLGIALGRIVVRPDAVGRWKRDLGGQDLGWFADELRAYGYLKTATRKPKKEQPRECEYAI